MPFDWQQLHARRRREAPVVDPRRRLRICLGVFATALLAVFAREVQLEISQGASFRAEAVRPIERRSVLRASRGRILARNGDVLAYDRPVQCVAVEYRWLQQPPDERWLRATARARLAKADRRNAQHVATAKVDLVRERAALAGRLAALCDLSPETWNTCTQQIQHRVERIAADANRRQGEKFGTPPNSGAAATPEVDAGEPWAQWVRHLLLDDPPPRPIVVAEELSPHVVASDVPSAVVTELKTHPERYPGTSIVERIWRTYPRGSLAAHVLGYLGPVAPEDLSAPTALLPDDLIGRAGVERQYDAVLRGRHGAAVQQSNQRGQPISLRRVQEAQPGGDVTLALDPNLQRTAEQLLQSAEQRRAVDGENLPGGGAIAVMDVRNGEILAAASAPAFDPNLFVHDEAGALAALLVDKTNPLVDRTCRMAIPPGSTFKVLTAVALMESKTVGPTQPFSCQGYLHNPARQRCEIYVRQGVGHGPVALADALCVSCNVYFFHFAAQMGPGPLVDWAQRFGFGRPTGIDLPGEASAALPSPQSLPKIAGRAWHEVDTQSMAIGQGTLEATPLEMLRMIAAVANGGRLLTPHVQKNSLDPFSPSSLGCSDETLRTIRRGLECVVADPTGTAHATAFLNSTAIAGKTGTAETGDGRASHAWFIGYAPADDPRFAFVVALEHAGDAATTAAPIAKRLVVRLEELGLL